MRVGYWESEGESRSGVLGERERTCEWGTGRIRVTGRVRVGYWESENESESGVLEE